MAEAASNFAGVIVIDPLRYDARAPLPADLAGDSELRQALHCLASEFPLDSLEDDEDESARSRTSTLDGPARYVGAAARQRSAVCVAARLDLLRGELHAETAALLARIAHAKSA